MTNKVIPAGQIAVGFDGTNLLFTDRDSSKIVAITTPNAAGTTTHTATTTSAASAYTGASSSLSATFSVAAETVLSNPPT